MTARMAHGQRMHMVGPARKETPTIVSNLSKFSPNYRQQQLANATSSDDMVCNQRRLQFEYGANIKFKLGYSIVVLATPTSNIFTLEEQVANLYDANTVLLEAQALLTSYEGQDYELVDNLTKILQVRLEAAKKDPELQSKLQEKLQHFLSMPLSPVNNLILEEWHQRALTFIGDLSILSSEIKISSTLSSAREKVNSVYSQLLQMVERDESLIISEPSKSVSDTIDPSRMRSIDEQLACMGNAEISGTSSTEERLRRLFHVYDMFYQIAKLYKPGQFDIASLHHLSDAFHLIRKELISLLGQFGTEPNLMDQYPNIAMDIVCQGACHALMSRANPLVQLKLAEMLESLRQAVNASPDMTLEHDFTKLAKLIFNLSLPTPAGVAEDEWTKYAAQILTPKESQDLLNSLQHLHSSFQTVVYGREEVSTIWLALWRGLKTTYLIARNEGFRLEWLDFPTEVEFFRSKTVRNQFELILSAPDALHPDIIENVVGDYCILITKCRASTDSAFGMLKQIKPTPVADWVLEKLSAYVAKQEWCVVGVRCMEKCAIRLNHIMQGPTFVRRMDRRGPKFATGCTAEWKPETVNMASMGSALNRSTPSSKSSSSSRSKQSQASSVTSPPSSHNQQNSSPDPPVPVPGGTYTFKPITKFNIDGHAGVAPPLDDGDDGTSQDPDSAMGGLPVVSAFDYVVYPFPETRAVEVAQSRQISREMSTGGIYSQGALPEDVINRPPRHVWPPGAVSIWAKPIPIDPINVVRDLWSSWRHGRPKRRSLGRARPHPQITQRTPRKDWVDQHPRLRPLYDRKYKVAKHGISPKSTGKQAGSSTSHIRVPKLRGGAPRSGDASQVPVPPPTLVATVVPTPPETIVAIPITERLQQLMNRIRGFWRGGDQPSPAEIRDLFLIPNAYDVDAAYEEIRDFLNHGVFDRSPDFFNPPVHHDVAQPQSPTTNGVHPLTNGVHPVANGVHPVTNGIHPLTNGTHLPTDDTHPVTNGIHPVTNGVHPITNGVHLHEDNTYPVTNGVRPLTNGVHPAPNGVQPAANGVVPRVNGVSPFVGLAVIPRTGLDSVAYGLPVIRSPARVTGLTSPTPQQRTQMAVRNVPQLDAPLPAQINTNDTNGGHPVEQPAADIQIYEDDPDRTLVDQHHQAQFDDQRFGLPPRQPGDNRSSQENIPPSSFLQGSQTPTPPTTNSVVVSPGCNTHNCHPCPVYSGLFHHVCQTTQSTAYHVRPPSPQDQHSSEESFLSQIQRNMRPHSPSMNPNIQVTVPRRPDIVAAYNAAPNTTGTNVTPEQQQPVTDTTPSVVGGHGLRNRNVLAARRAARDEGTHTPEPHQATAAFAVPVAPAPPAALAPTTITSTMATQNHVPTPLTITPAQARVRARSARRRRGSTAAFRPQTPTTPPTPGTPVTPDSSSNVSPPTFALGGSRSARRRRRTAARALATPRRRNVAGGNNANNTTATNNGGSDADSDAGADYTNVTPMGGTEPPRRRTRAATRAARDAAGTV